MQLTRENNSAVDAPYWAWVNKLLIDGRPFDLEGRAYQLEMMRPVTDDGKRKLGEVIKKGTQTGATMGKALEICHGALHGLYPQGVINYFPSKVAVEDYSGARFKSLLTDNKILKDACNDINAVHKRRIGKTNISFLGCSGTTIIGGMAKDSTAVRQTPADWVLLDERDLFDDEMANQVNQRLGNSNINRRTDMGSPKLPDSGIDLLYSKSDMRRWQIKCDHCRKSTCMETDFPQCIGLRDGKGYPKCVHCGKEIDRSNGLWIPDRPDVETVGYWFSQLLNPNRDLAHVLKEYDDPLLYKTTEAEFQRTVMGNAYARAEDVLRESEVLSLCDNTHMAYSHDGPCAMGFDVGYPLIHVVIGHRIGNDKYRIVRAARVKEWDDLHHLARQYNVKASVGDAMPESHKIREFAAEAARYGNTVYPCYTQAYLKSFDIWGADNIVKVNKTDIFDQTHRMITNPGMLLLPRRCHEIDIYAHQMTQVAKFLETDSKGNVSYRYCKIGDKQDHYRCGTNFFYLACKKVGTLDSHRNRRKEVMQDTSYRLGENR